MNARLRNAIREKVLLRLCLTVAFVGAFLLAALVRSPLGAVFYGALSLHVMAGFPRDLKLLRELRGIDR